MEQIVFEKLTTEEEEKVRGGDTYIRPHQACEPQPDLPV